MAGVELRKVVKRYGDTQVVHGVDCSIADGEFLVIVGPSGCGKSTLLRMIAGLEAISEGEIEIGGRVVNALEPAERDIAMVFQNYALYPHMSVYANMAYGLKIRGLPKSEIDERVRRAAAILELGDDLLQRKPRQLSGGQRQRVAMGRAIVRNPQVFLFDEPLSNLDAKLRVQMRLEIKTLQESLGITSVYVTHDQVEAMTLGHRLLVLNGGIVEQLGPPIELYERPASLFVAGFIGSPAMNFVQAAVSAEGGALELPGGERFALAKGLGAALAGRPVVLGVRPEHLELAGDMSGELSGELAGDVSGDGKGAAHLSVGVVEQLGADTLVHGHFGSDRTSLTLRLHGTHGFRPDEILPLGVRPERLHLFDPETGKRLEAPA